MLFSINPLNRRNQTVPLGRQLGPLDRPETDRIVREFEQRGYGFRDFIELVVTSEVFVVK